MLIILKICMGSSQKWVAVNQLLPYVTLSWFMSPHHMESIRYSGPGLNFSRCTQVTPGVLLMFYLKYIILRCGMYSLTRKSILFLLKWDLLAAGNQINHPSACFSEWKYGLGSGDPVGSVRRLNTWDRAEFRDSDGTHRYLLFVFTSSIMTFTMFVFL